MADDSALKDTLAGEGKDAVCFTAGFSGALFGAGTIHAYLAARRSNPQVAAGISMGALSAAAMQRCYQELQSAKVGQEESARWAWFRRYLTALSDQPLSIFWDAIPDQSDFFADFPPILDASTPENLQAAEKEARRRRYLLVKLGQWIAGLPVKVRTATSTMVMWVRAKENYPGPRLLRRIMFAFWAVRLVGGIARHVTFAPQFFSYRYELEPWKQRIRWWFRPLFGWKIWLLSFIPLLIVVLGLAALIVALAAPAANIINSKQLWEPIQPFLKNINVFWPALEFIPSLLLAVAFFIVETAVFLFAGVLIATNGTALLNLLLQNTGLTKSVIDDFHLRRKLTEIFEPDGQRRSIGKDPMEILLVSAWLNTLRDRTGKALRSDQRWAANGSPLVDSLKTALTKVPIFEPTRLTKPEDIMQWVKRDVEPIGRAVPPKVLDLVDGSAVRENPLPALFSFLRLREPLAETLSSNGNEPSIHVVYSVPLPSAQGNQSIAEQSTDIVSVGMASLKLAKRRDTQLEVMQTNFMSRVEKEIRDRQEAISKAAAAAAGAGSVAQASTGSAAALEPQPVPSPNSPGTKPRPPQASAHVATKKFFSIFADEIAPDDDLAFDNPINPTRTESLDAVASGCRHTLQTLYRRTLAAGGAAGSKVSCKDFLKQLVELRGGAAPAAQACGLPEVCARCTGELIRPSQQELGDWFKTSSVSRNEDPLEPGDRTMLQRFPQLSSEHPRIVFVASGGVFRGAFHIGMIAALVQAKIRPDVIVGASVGTLMGGALGALFNVPDDQKWGLLATLTDVFLHVDEKVAFTKTLKSATRELGVRGRSVKLSPAQIRRVVRKGARSDPGFAVSGAPPAVVDAISDIFMIPHRRTASIAAELISGHVTKATYSFLYQLRKESLLRLDIRYAIMGASLLEQTARQLLGAPLLNLNCVQPYQGVKAGQDIAFFATTTDLGSKTPHLLGRRPADHAVPYDFVEAGLSSSAFPCVFAPRRQSDVVPGQGAIDVRYSDGGMFDNLPFLPAIDILSEVQTEYRKTTSISPRDFLAHRHAWPDLFLAGSLNVNPEDDPSDDGKKNSPFETIFAINARTKLLENNQKIRSFENASEAVHSRLGELLGLLNSPGAAVTAESEKLLDSIVDSAVLPVFPSSPDHLNGTFEFCASLGMQPAKIRRSIADGCFQTLKSFADATTGSSFAAQVVQNFHKVSDSSGDPRIPEVGMRLRKDPPPNAPQTTRSAPKNACPYFTIAGAAFQCPFTRLDGVFRLDGPTTREQAEAEERKIEGVKQIYETCVDDKSHSKTIWPETAGNPLLKVFMPARRPGG
ncbi:MAG TPA: patatin-like phospholipase family protein [Bryobacteraceae bacterium]|nr:patatin-like phospholipase family protein [Bryobacteraceae bacterium]